MALMDVEFYDVESSNVSQIGYDGDEMVLYVRFNNGYLYFYEGVPPDVWEQMLYSDSKGRFVHTNLKGRYPYGRVE
jgi:hypothetical protein